VVRRPEEEKKNSLAHLAICQSLERVVCHREDDVCFGLCGPFVYCARLLEVDCPNGFFACVVLDAEFEDPFCLIQKKKKSWSYDKYDCRTGDQRNE
jgi:hypothetical protein